MSTRVYMGIGAVVILALGSYFLFFHDNRKIVNAPVSPTAPIVAFGDSLVYGVGALRGNDFVSLLAVNSGKKIVNMGVSGDTTEKALARIEEARKLKPGLVIVLLGGNDYLQRIPKEKTFENLERIIRTFQSDGAAVLLLGVRGGLLQNTYEEDFAAVAEKMGTGYVSDVLEELLGNKSLMSDQIHPNDAGYRLIAERVYPEFLRFFED